MVLLDLNCTPPVQEEENVNILHQEDVNILEQVLHQQEEENVNILQQEEENVNILQQEEDETGVEQARRKRKTLTDEQRYAAYMAMQAISMTKGEDLKGKGKQHVATLFEADIQIIQRIWKTAKKQLALGQQVDVSSKRKQRCGRKAVDDFLSEIPKVPLNRRSTVRSLACALGVSHMTLYRKFKLGKIRRHSNNLRPSLKEKNKRERIEFCMKMLDPTTLDDARPSFNKMHNIIHIDEKWFVMTKKNRNYYLLPEEEDPIRTVQNKNSIGKVMFLTAVARPRYDADGNVTFSGKIGVWPFVKEVAAVRRSENRERGTLETKSVIVNREVMREYMIEKVIPAIKEVWPADDLGQQIFIQQDNARTHILPNDPLFIEAVAQTGLNIKLMQQPANSPDLNALDLGFFGGLQSHTDCRAPTTIIELIEGVESEFDEYEVAKLNKIFLTLQTCMVEVMNHGGGNAYKIPHLNKQRLEREGLLPPTIHFPRQVYENALQILGQDIQ